MHRPKRINLLAALTLAALLAGCGGSGSSPQPVPPVEEAPAAPPELGQLALTLTDAEGDFVAYIVDVTSIRLETAGGTVVETLPASSSVDFTELTDISEFLSVASVPQGTYDSAVITLDYSDAEIIVQLEDGEPVAATVLDADGAPIETLDVALSLEGDAAIRITPATIHAFSLDFDLDASNTIDDTTSPPTVIVEPVMLAAPSFDEDREHRLRGRLVSVDSDAEAVTLSIRPFLHQSTSHGEITFEVTETTTYEISGEVLTGTTGLQALATLDAESPVVATGETEERTLIADRVIAGDSVFWSEMDIAKGVVRARDGSSLTLGGVSVSTAENRRPAFLRTLTVLVDDLTEVVAAGVDKSLDQFDVSVGQEVVITGELVDDGTLDASEGRIRMQRNKLWGDVITATPLVVDLQLLNGRRPEVFDFTGTGVVEAEDTDPDAYEIGTGNLSSADLDAGELVQVRGLIARFGFAPPDFEAQSIIDPVRDEFTAIAKVRWPDGTANPFAAISSDRVDIDLEDARVSLSLKGRFRSRSLSPDSLALIAPENGDGIYSIIVRGDGLASIYRSFEEATNAMTELLNGGAVLSRVAANGSYTDSTSELVTRRANFIFVRDGG